MLRRQTEFSVGQRVRKKSRGGGVWEILAIRKDNGGIVNIEMLNVEDMTTRRTLSSFVVSDPEQFELVSA